MAAEPLSPPRPVRIATAPAPVDPPPPDPALMAALTADHRARRRRWVVLGAIVVAALALVVVAIVRRTGATQTTYVTAPIERGTLSMPVAASGSVEPRNAVDVGADISGRVEAVLVDANDRVQAGDVLARLQTDVLDLAVQQAQAAVVSAQANRVQAEIAWRDAKAAMSRATALRASNVVSGVDYEQAQSSLRRSVAALGVVDASIATAKAGLLMAQANQKKAAIKAPISGVILSRHVEPGQVVISALQAAVLFRLAEDLSHLQVRADIDEADVGRVREGQEATFSVSAAPERVYRARVKSVTNAPQLQQQVVTYEAILDVENADDLLRPGMTASIKVQAGSITDALLVPSVALRFAPAAARAKEKAASAGHPKTTVENVAPTSARVWILQGTSPVPRDVVIVGSDGERTAVTGVVEGDLVVVAEGGRP